MPGKLPTILKGSSESEGTIRDTARTSVFSGARSVRKKRVQASSSISRAMRTKSEGANSGPTTSVGRLGQSKDKTTTSALRSDSSSTMTSVYGRSRAEGEDLDERRYEYARRKIFAKKRKKKKEMLKAVESKLKGQHRKGAREVMRKIVKKYAWKKPLDEQFDKKLKKEIHTKIDQAAPFHKVGDRDVEKMKKMIDNFE